MNSCAFSEEKSDKLGGGGEGGGGGNQKLCLSPFIALKGVD